jgi:septal ring-binding cell division protein DamX
MLAAYAANTYDVSLKHVTAAVADSEFSAAARSRGRRVWHAWTGVAVAGALAMGVALTAAHYLLASAGPAPITPPPSAVAALGSEATPHPAPEPARLSTPVKPKLPVGTIAASTLDRTAAPAPPAVRTTRRGGATPPASPPALNAKALLEQRLLVTERWLAEEQEGVFSIQLLGSNDIQLLRSYLETLNKYIEEDKIFVFRTVANRMPSMTILYGAFPARAQAVKSLQALPGALKANRPYIRTVQGVRSELAHNKAS